MQKQTLWELLTLTSVTPFTPDTSIPTGRSETSRYTTVLYVDPDQCGRPPVIKTTTLLKSVDPPIERWGLYLAQLNSRAGL